MIVAPYKFIMTRQGKVVFDDPPATKTFPACLSDDLNPAASKCKHCGSASTFEAREIRPEGRSAVRGFSMGPRYP